MNKAKLVEIVANANGITKKEAESIVDTVFVTISNSLIDGKDVELSSFGKFKITERKQRKGINPNTKEEIIIPASKSVNFKVSKKIKDLIK